MSSDVPAPAVKSAAVRLAVTVVAEATFGLLYVPAVCVTVKLCPLTRRERLKLAEVKAAVVVPS